jgi:hypothetical protein
MAATSNDSIDRGMKIIGTIILNLIIVVSGVVIGAIVVGSTWLILGLLLARGYTKRGPTDPGDAPAYVGLELIFFGTIAGAILGFVAGVAICILRSIRARKEASYFAENPGTTSGNALQETR